MSWTANYKWAADLLPEYKQKQVFTVQLLDSDDMISKYSYYSEYEVKTHKYIVFCTHLNPLLLVVFKTCLLV